LSGQYHLEKFKSNEKLRNKIKSGKGDPAIYRYPWSYIPAAIFGGTSPEKIEMDENTGKSNIERAKASRYGVYYDRNRIKGLRRSWFYEWENRFHANAAAFTDTSLFVNIYTLTGKAFGDSIGSNIKKDLNTVALSGLAAFFYALFVLGSFSPIHLRMIPAVVGFICIAFSFMGC
jgi:hypothetical protein